MYGLMRKQEMERDVVPAGVIREPVRFLLIAIFNAEWTGARSKETLGYEVLYASSSIQDTHVRV